jgi:hypothetical protein
MRNVLRRASSFVPTIANSIGRRSNRVQTRPLHTNSSCEVGPKRLSLRARSAPNVAAGHRAPMTTSGSTPVTGPAPHRKRRRPRLMCRRDRPATRVVCADSPLLVSVQQKNADNRMSLQFVQYLDRCTFESCFAQLDRDATSILFLNATLRDQRGHSNRSRPLRLHVNFICMDHQRRRPEIQPAEEAIGAHLSNTERGILKPPDNRFSLNCRGQQRGNYGSVGSAAVVGSELSVDAHWQPAATTQKKVTISNSVDACRHFMLAVADGAALRTGLHVISSGHSMSGGMPSAAPIWQRPTSGGPGQSCRALPGPRTVETGHNRS